MQFTAKGIISAKNRNSVEVEGNKYWISGLDMSRIAEFYGFQPDRRFDQMPDIEGIEVNVKIHRDENGCWAELANQSDWCPLPYC